MSAEPEEAVTPERSALMKRVRQKHTAPELALRRALHAAGYRFRLHDPRLPGRPDITLPGRRVAIFVHGCFWHGHACPAGRRPRTRRAFWDTKLDANRARDAVKEAALVALGWRVEVVWTCELRDLGACMARLGTSLGRPGANWRESNNAARSAVDKLPTGDRRARSL